MTLKSPPRSACAYHYWPVPAGRHFILRGNVSRRQPYQLGPATGVLPYRRDRAGGGLTVLAGGMNLTADVTWNQQEGLSSLMSYAGGMYAPRTVADIRLSLSGSYWSDAGDTGEQGLALSGRLNRRFGKLDAGLGYQYYASEILGRVERIVTDAATAEAVDPTSTPPAL